MDPGPPGERLQPGELSAPEARVGPGPSPVAPLLRRGRREIPGQGGARADRERASHACQYVWGSAAPHTVPTNSTRG